MFLCCLCAAQAFQIDLPRGYIEKRDAKWKTEAETIWREIDRTVLESIIREFVGQHPKVDGVDLSGTIAELAWKFEVPRSISCGAWSVSLLAWEASYPKLTRIKWDESTILISIAYDWKRKELAGDATGEIRLLLDLTRSGPVFGKKVIRPHYRASDYGEVWIDLPFGGIELRKDGQSGSRE